MIGMGLRQSKTKQLTYGPYDEESDWIPDFGRRFRWFTKAELEKFMMAASDGNYQALVDFLQEDMDPNVLNPYNRSALCLAVLAGHANIVSELLRAGARVTDAYDFDPMLYRRRIYGPTRSEALDSVQPVSMDGVNEHEDFYLARSLAVLDRPHRTTLLHVAIVMHHVKIVKLLTNLNNPGPQSFINTRNSFRQRPIDVAYAVSCSDCMKALCKAGAEVIEPVLFHSKQTTSLLGKAIIEKNLKMLKIICSQSVNLHDIPTNCSSYLNMAVQAEDMATVEFLLSKGVPIVHNTTSVDIPTIVAAVMTGNVEVTRLLLDRGLFADMRLTMPGTSNISVYESIRVANQRIKRTIPEFVNVPVFHQNVTRVLHVAVISGSTPHMVQLLLERGASPHPDSTGNPSPLTIAVHAKRSMILRTILTFERSRDSATRINHIVHYAIPLIYALRMCNQMSWEVQFLLEFCSYPQEVCNKTANGQTPLYVALTSDLYMLNVELLLKAGADPDRCRMNEAKSSLHVVLRQTYTPPEKRFDIMMLLLKHGANLEIKDSLGLNSCARAFQMEDFASSRFLLEAGTTEIRNIRTSLSTHRSDLDDNTVSYVQVLMWFGEITRHPRSLSSLCIIGIRKSLGRRLLKSYRRLEIARMLQDALIFKQLEYLKPLFRTNSPELVYQSSLWSTT